MPKLWSDRNWKKCFHFLSFFATTHKNFTTKIKRLSRYIKKKNKKAEARGFQGPISIALNLAWNKQPAESQTASQTWRNYLCCLAVTTRISEKFVEKNGRSRAYCIKLIKAYCY